MPTDVVVTRLGPGTGFHLETLNSRIATPIWHRQQGNDARRHHRHSTKKNLRGLSPRATSPHYNRSPEEADTTIAATSAGRAPLSPHHIASRHSFASLPPPYTQATHQAITPAAAIAATRSCPPNDSHDHPPPAIAIEGGGAAVRRRTSRNRACDNPPRKIPYYRLRPIHFGR
jgi:hypothetical protein